MTTRKARAPAPESVAGVPVELSAATVERLKVPVRKVWSQIAYDANALALEYTGKDIKQSEAMEQALDAGRIGSKFGANDPEADALVSALCAAYGYKKVERFLSKHIRLV